jgi:H+-transporting ATPase
MTLSTIDLEEAKKKEVQELFFALATTPQGLSSQEAKNRLLAYGSNSIKEIKESLIWKFLRYFWGPLPWMIEIAALLSLLVHHIPDFCIIVTLLLVNGLIDFLEEFQAGSAIEALKKKLAKKSIAKRDGQWMEIGADLLVPGDIIRLRLGQIIPADSKLIDGEFLSVDQSSLTGESLPVTKRVGDVVCSGAIVKQGEMVALVIGTGKNTFFGKTAKLVEKAHPTSHFQNAILQIGDYLISVSLVLAFFLTVVQLLRGTALFELIQFVLILIVASIPVAMPAVLSVTMAVGALKLAKEKAVVTKLESIEEMAGIDILCSDKTGTLTENKLTLGDPVVFQNGKKETALLIGALASKEENQDPIDLAVIAGIKKRELLTFYKQIKFVPFDPITKKTEATIQDANGSIFYVTKGAPQVILALSNLPSSNEKEIRDAIFRLGEKGYRTLGVAQSLDQKNWEFCGLLPLFDPLSPDSKKTITDAKGRGIEVKMRTGDNIAIAREIAKELHMGENIESAEELLGSTSDWSSRQLQEKIEKSNGFAQVFPEHKFQIVQALQNKKHIVGMTGDGVNDSPALKEADVGIAVAGATEAAQSAASLVLLAPGLSVIIRAIEEARRIFERMNSYAIYRIAETIRVMLFMVFSILIFNFYPVSAIMIILLALLNDIPIMAIVFDNTVLDKKPVRWEMRKVLTCATALGFMGVLASFLLLVFAKDYLQLNIQQIQSFIFLKLSIAGHLMLFVARSKHFFFSKPYPSPILIGAILSTQAIAVLVVGMGWFVTPLPWLYIGFIWLYAIFWTFVNDFVKIFVMHHVNFQSAHHRKFLSALQEDLHSHMKE